MLPSQQKTLADLAEISRMLDKAVETYAEFDEEAIIAKSDYEVAYARTFLASEGPMEIRKQQTILDTWQERLDAERSEASVRAVRERIRKLHAQLEVQRSINAAQRAQFQAEPTGQWT